MRSKAISGLLVLVGSFWTSFTPKFDHFVESTLAQSSWWLRFACFGLLFFFLTHFLFLFLFLCLSSAFRDPFFFGQGGITPSFSIFIFLFKFCEEFLVLGLLLLDDFLLLALGNNFKAFDHSFDLHEPWMLVPIDGEELVQGGVRCELLADGSQFQTKVKVVVFYDFYLAFLGAESFFLDRWSKEFSGVHISFKQEASKFLQDFCGFLVQHIEFQSNRILLAIFWFLCKFLELLADLWSEIGLFGIRQRILWLGLSI